MTDAWWLSFVDRTDDVAVHLGVTVVFAADLNDAVREAWRHRCNPGGEVAGTHLERLPHTVPAYRLMTDLGEICAAQIALSGIDHG